MSKRTMIVVDFLDPEKPVVGEKFINSLVLDPKESLQFLLEQVIAEEGEGRTLVTSMRTVQMTTTELENMGEWEP